MSSTVGRCFEDLRERWHDIRRAYLDKLWRIFHPVPVLFSVVVTGLLAKNGQLHEIYLMLAERGRLSWYVAGFASLAILSWALFTSYLVLARQKLESRFGNTSSTYVDPILRRLLDWVAFSVALLPFLGVMIGMWCAEDAAKQAHTKVEKSLALIGQMNVRLDRDGLNQATGFLATIVVASSVGLLLHLGGRGRASSGAVRVVAGGLFVLSGLFLYSGDGILLSLTDLIGPLGAIGLQFVLLLTLFVLLTHMMPKARKLAGFGLLCGVFALSFLDGAAVQGTKTLQVGRSQVEQDFDVWLDSRNIRAMNVTDRPRFPVFIVAAQGGGIYAATATAAFLARQQDLNASFSQHVFAISGVSGGSVGAALFAALNCGKSNWGAGQVLTERVRQAITADHLSAPASLMVTDMARILAGDIAKIFVLGMSKLTFGLSGSGQAQWIDALAPSMDRATALELSLTQAITKAKPERTGPRNETCGWQGSVKEHWRPGVNPAAQTPALVLNTTDATSGTTVAFAPFSLSDLKHDGLAAFSDAPYASNQATPLITAAVASARFPLVAAPFHHQSADGKREWDFVDGGYADNSGLVTAGAIYKALLPIAKMRNVELRLIVLAAQQSEIRPARPAGESLLRDFWSPIAALLNVNAGLGTQKVATTINNFHLGSEGASPVLVVRYETEFLGWSLARSTFVRIDATVSPKTACIERQALDDELKVHNGLDDKTTRRASMVRENACTVQTLNGLLKR